MNNKSGAGGLETAKDILQEKRHIDETMRLLLKTLARKRMTTNDRMAVSVMLHNIYMGIENILRRILLSKKIKIDKTSTWHKDMLGKSAEAGIVSEELRGILYKYLQFRHLHMHGYGHMLEWDDMKSLADNANETVERFFSELRKGKYLPNET
jgi:hypothetical protein